MRNIASTNAGVEVAEEYAEYVVELVDADRSPVRATTTMSADGQIDTWIRLHTYTAPDGVTRWAVDYTDCNSRELEEADEPGEVGRAEAEARYEHHVRESANLLGVDREGIDRRFHTTDVDGVPGPLPDLPELTYDHLEQLIDSPAEDPVLHLERTEDGEGDELAVAVGPAAQVPSAVVLLSRRDLIQELGRPDTGSGTAGRLAYADLDEDDDVVAGHALREAEERRRAAAGVLF
ncbi:hypothetical protein [Streptomyces sp. DH12]|uniref:hypothetical protein n=1 Tax=Streptomyces sp. DH12 TaxID=2857010 RepID=UPI001E2DD8CB|nr:hypothetical protein [Streptomyces sp. DH12]